MPRTAIIACAMASLLGLMLIAPAGAQIQVDLGFGHGHHGHHHGWHHHGWYDYGWYPPRYAYRPYVDYVYVTPPPPPQVTYVQPANPVAMQSNVDLSARPAASPTLPTARRNSLPASDARQMVIRNSTNSTVNVFFRVNGTAEYELAPGQAKILNDSANYEVEYDRGGDFGTATQQLQSGAYEFVVSHEGWELQRATSGSSDTASRVIKKNALPVRK